MGNKAVPPQYKQIALDLANRIYNGELQEDEKIYGRSVMASEYGVSSETVRKAIHLLDKMKVVIVKPQSGVKVLSRDNAGRYIELFSDTADLDYLRKKLSDIMETFNSLQKEMQDTVEALAVAEETYSAANRPLVMHEIAIPENSPLIGKCIGELNVWQETGATIAAIRRNKNIIVSPGPYAEFYGGDVLIYVGKVTAEKRMRTFINCEK